MFGPSSFIRAYIRPRLRAAVLGFTMGAIWMWGCGKAANHPAAKRG
jgi:hypothetical protein